MNIELTGGNRSQYLQSIQKMDHNIQETGLFSNGNLIRALDSHPTEKLDICKRGSFQTCARGTTSSIDLLKAVAKGALWLNLREIESVPSPHGRLVNHMHKAFNRHLNVRSSSRVGGLVISSPNAVVNYHINLTDVTLWHLRGKKTDLYLSKPRPVPATSPCTTPRNVRRCAAYSLRLVF